MIDIINNPDELSELLYELHMTRKRLNQKYPRKNRLTKNQRLQILEKTGFKCHVCGEKIVDGKFQADHVESHARGGLGVVDNFLPSCSTCNNFRWHYLPEEIHWVLKLGVYAKTQIEKKSALGINFADSFLKYDKKSKRNTQSRKLNRTKEKFKN